MFYRIPTINNHLRTKSLTTRNKKPILFTLKRKLGMVYTLACCLNQGSEGFLPCVHLDNLHGIDDLVHDPHPLISTVGSGHSQLGEHPPQPCFKQTNGE